jgi:quinol monooxygenase YgiN
MAEPIVFINRFRIKPGMAEAFRQHYEASIAPVRDGKPGTLVQVAYENEDATAVVVVRVFPDADSLDQQLQGANERSRRTYEFVEPVSIELYGQPNPAALERMTKISGSGIVVQINPAFIGGFIR